MSLVSPDNPVSSQPAVLEDIATLTPDNLLAYYQKHGFVLLYPEKSLQTVEVSQLKLDDNVGEADRRYVVGLLNRMIVSFLNKPVVLDPFDTDELQRAKWKESVEKKLGFEGLKKTYDQGKLRREWLTIAIFSIKALMQMQNREGFNLGLDIESLQDRLDSLEARIKPKGKQDMSAPDPYAFLSTSEKVTIVQEVTRLGLDCLAHFLPDEKETLEKFQVTPFPAGDLLVSLSS